MSESPTSLEPKPLPAEPEHRCANCGSTLAGHFCAICGQPNKEIRRPFFALIRELLNVLLDLDGRAYRSVFFLFTRPAFLSRAYVEGQRFRYTPPLRLFLAVSIIFFIVVTVQNSLQSLSSSLNEIGTGQATEQAAVAPAAEPDAPADTSSRIIDIRGDFDPEDLRSLYDLIEQINLPGASQQTNDNLHALMQTQARANYEDFVEDPAGFLSGYLEYITVFMLSVMPVLAFIQFILFFPARRYYIEHLVLTLHNTAFVILVFLLQTILSMIADADLYLVSGSAAFLETLMVIWLPVYLLLSLKFFFGFGWLATVPLYLLTSLFYLICVTTSAVVLGLTAFLLF